MLQSSDACERNKEPILTILRGTLGAVGSILEIGSGTAQHAVYFAAHLPHLIWRTSDLPENIPAIQARLNLEGIANVLQPVILDVSRQPWPVEPVDAIFTANTLHIMSWQHAEDFFSGTGYVLKPGGKLCVYGPFKYNGDYTSPSNAQFDNWLKQRDPLSGVRDFEAVNTLAGREGLILNADHAMPANNRLLVWEKINAEKTNSPA
jgi:SAM-dependent methyltransferase